MNDTLAPPSARYRDYAAARRQILSAASQRIPLVSVAQQARALSLWNGKAVEPGDEAQLAMVYDLGVLDPLGGHHRGIDRQLKAAPPAEGSTEDKVMQALLRAEFGLFRLLGAHPEGGASAEPLGGGEPVLVMDRFLGTRAAGEMFGARLAWVDPDFAMTCGAVVPVDTVVVERVLANSPPERGPVRPRLPNLAEEAAALEKLLAEPAARMRLAALPKTPGFAAQTYRAAIDRGLAGAVPGRTPNAQ